MKARNENDYRDDKLEVIKINKRAKDLMAAFIARDGYGTSNLDSSAMMNMSLEWLLSFKTTIKVERLKRHRVLKIT